MSNVKESKVILGLTLSMNGLYVSIFKYTDNHIHCVGDYGPIHFCTLRLYRNKTYGDLLDRELSAECDDFLKREMTEMRNVNQ